MRISVEVSLDEVTKETCYIFRCPSCHTHGRQSKWTDEILLKCRICGAVYSLVGEPVGKTDVWEWKLLYA